MKVRTGDLFGAFHASGPYATVITTNGEVTNTREAVMGRGVALWAATTWPELKRSLGKLLDTCGNHCYVIPVTRQKGAFVVTFPTKRSWKQRSDLALIERSCVELVGLADVYGWERVFLPRPGCGNGGRDWLTEVRPILKKYLDDRFVVVWEDKHDKTAPKPTEVKVAAKVGAVSKAAQKRMGKK